MILKTDSYLQLDVDEQFDKESKMTKNKAFHGLVALALISFGFFGSLSHIFTFGLVMLITFHALLDYKNFKPDFSKILLSLFLTGAFYFFFCRSIFSHNAQQVLDSLAPMLAIPILGFLIIIRKNKDFEISTTTLAKFARLSIIITFFVYLLLMYFPEIYPDAAIGNGASLELLSGNPIPFSIILLCLSLMSLSSWRKDGKKEKFQTLFCLFFGLYLALYLANSRGTILAFVLSTPFIAWFILRSLKYLIVLVVVGIAITYLVIKLQISGLIDNDHLYRIIKGVITLTTGVAIDNSSFERIELWSASLIVVSKNPILGYGLPERFSAILPVLGENFLYRYSHPHNDILASAISAGLFGGLLGLISIVSPLWAWILTKRNSSGGMFLGITFSVIFFTSASFNTVFFNDITSAWLAFSTFLICCIKEN